MERSRLPETLMAEVSLVAGVSPTIEYDVYVAFLPRERNGAHPSL